MRLDYGVLGQWLLIVSVIAIVIEGAVAGAWAFRIARKARTLRERVAVEQGRLRSDVEGLRLAIAETAALWQPYARLLRWLRHPLAIALLQSLARRRAAARVTGR